MKFRIGFSDGYLEKDNERAITPVLIYIKEPDPKFVAFGFALGWWRWAVYLFIGWNK